jgi:MFS family permease
MLFFGIGFLIVVTVLAQFLAAPPPGYQPPDVVPGGHRAADAAVINLGPAEILRAPLFYLLWIMFAFAAGAGLMIIGNITTIAKLGKIEAGFILVALLAIGNAAGRIIAGMLSDRIGRLWTMCIIFLFQAGLMMVLRMGLTDMTAFIIVSMLLGFNYGACLSVFPSAVKDNFGLKNFGINYGLVFTAWGVGGLVFPLVAGKIFEAAKRATGTGSYNDAYLAAAALLVVASALTFATRTMERRHKMQFGA